MRWTPGGRSDNLEDRRGERGIGGGGVRLGVGGTVVVLVLSLIFGRDFFSEIGAGGGAPAPSTTQPTRGASGGEPIQTTPAEEKLVSFVSFVLDDAQETWAKLFADRGAQYTPAKLVLFRDAIESACGFAQSATGPFYCPGDDRVYIDLGFYSELQRRFGAPGDFAQAYVLAHEIGHHVQRLIGTEREVRRAQQEQPGSGNALSVAMELQADCYAGVWAWSAQQRQKLEPGDVDEGLAAAAAVGDDRLQKMGQGHVNPESFTHGSSAQRTSWFKRGMRGGRIDDCDTFAAQGR